MPAATICIPAYRSGSSLVPTLRSALGQTRRDLRVEVAIEGTDDAEETLTVCRDFEADPRLRVRVNDGVLGWAENIDAMLGRVETPFYLILPHDDLLHPEYVERLLAEHEREPGAAVAYADMFFLGPQGRRKSSPIGRGDRDQRLQDFYLAGAEAVPWRGVTRTALLGEGLHFPSNSYRSFAVECEYAQRLVASGPALYLPMSLFFKRDHEPGVTSVSRSWTSHGDPELLGRALDHHRSMMYAGLEALAADAQGWLGLCLESAMLRREALLGRGLRPLPEARRCLAKELHLELGEEEHPTATRLRAMVATALARDAQTRGEPDEALAWSARGVEEEGAGAETHLMRADLLSNRSDAFRAIPHLEEAVRLAGISEKSHRLMCLLRERLSGGPSAGASA